MTTRLLTLLILLAVVTSTAYAQQFAGSSASNSNADAVRNEDVFRSFKDEDYSRALIQPKWYERELHGYTKAQWQVGILADGDFSRALTDKSVTPRTGQLGINAIKSVAIYQLRTPQKFTNGDDLKAFFSHDRERAQLYDQRRGGMSWQEFDLKLTSWRQRVVEHEAYKAKVSIQVNDLKRDSSLAANGSVYILPRYQALEATRRVPLQDQATAAQLAVTNYDPRYRKFVDALNDQYKASPVLRNTFNIDSASWTNGQGIVFLDSQRIALLRTRVAAESGLPTNPAKEQRARQLRILTLPLENLFFAFGPGYLDSIANKWPQVRNTQHVLSRNAARAQQAALTSTVFSNAEYNAIVRQLQNEYATQLRTQRDTLARISQRLYYLKQAVNEGTLPFEKLRYRNRIELNMIVSLGNGTDSLRARAQAGPPPVITNRTLFGSNLLVPGSAVQAARSVSMNILINPFTPLRTQQASFGFHGFFNYSTTRWALPGILRDSSALDSTYQLGIFSLSAGVQYTIFEVPSTINAAGNREGNNIKIAFQADMVYRNIGGELGRPRHAGAREEFLGTRRRDYIGFQPSFIASIDNFRVTVSYPIFAQGEIPGFSNGGYPVIGFGFSGDLQAGHSKPSGAKPWRRLW